MELITDLLKNKQYTSISEMRNESSWLKADPEVILWLCQEPSSTAATAYRAHFPATSHPDDCSNFLSGFQLFVQTPAHHSHWCQLSAVTALLLPVSCPQDFTWLAVAHVKNLMKHVGVQEVTSLPTASFHHLQGYHSASASDMLNEIPKPENFNRRNSYSLTYAQTSLKGKKNVFSHFY